MKKGVIDHLHFHFMQGFSQLIFTFIGEKFMTFALVATLKIPLGVMVNVSGF